jgi:hypothetical protein
MMDSGWILKMKNVVASPEVCRLYLTSHVTESDHSARSINWRR